MSNTLQQRKLESPLKSLRISKFVYCRDMELHLRPGESLRLVCICVGYIMGSMDVSGNPNTRVNCTYAPLQKH